MNNFGEKQFSLILGNGFDLSLGLRTRYSDFANSDEWKELYANFNDKKRKPSLLKFLKYKSNVDAWFDIEQALFEYAKYNNYDAAYRNVGKDEMEFTALCHALGKYLKKHVGSRSHSLAGKAGTQLLQKLQWVQNKRIYTFNYTPLDILQDVMGIHPVMEAIYIHGKANDNSLILGFETNRVNDIIPGYSFLLKSYNPSYSSIELFQDMKMSDEVIIFGHSMNMIDSVYFDDFLRELVSNQASKHKITIICKDEMSKNSILDNIKNMGISIPKLFQYGKMEFILTENIKDDTKDKIAFEKLLDRITD